MYEVYELPDRHIAGQKIKIPAGVSLQEFFYSSSIIQIPAGGKSGYGTVGRCCRDLTYAL